MIRVAAYCRVSTDQADQANSFAAQQRYFRAYIDGRTDWELAGIYADEGITGTSTKKRVQFNRMLRDAYAGRFQLIVTKEISRFSRNILDTITHTRQLRQAGVGVLFLTENLDTRKPETEMLLTLMGILAQEESRRTSVRVKWGQTRQMERGVVFGRSLLGYRVSGGVMTVSEPEAELVRRIFHSYAMEGKGAARIARELEAAGYRTSTGNPRWSPGHILKILKNEKYVGDLIQKKSCTPDYLTHCKKPNRGQEPRIILRDHHAPIVSRELWDRCQELLARKDPHRGGHSNRYLFSGRIRCGSCGSVFVGRQKKMADGRVVRRWTCGGGCGVGRVVRDDDARQMLRDALNSLPLDRQAITADALAAIADRDTAALQRRRELLGRKRDAALDSCFAGELPMDQLRGLLAGYERELKHLAEQLAQGRADRERLRQLLHALLHGTAESDALNRALLDSLTVFADRHMELKLTGIDRPFRFIERTAPPEPVP